MTIDVERHLGGAQRSVTALERDGKPARAVTLTRTYDTDIADLWEAISSVERLPRWFLPVEGDLRPGGRYQLKGNAGGTITRCEPPALLALTWEMFGDVSWVNVELEKKSDNRTRLILTHTAHVSDHWTQFGPGAAGVGWELGLMGLALHLADPQAVFDEAEFSTSPQARAFITGSSHAWGEAAIASGEDPGSARRAALATESFYTGLPPAQS